MKSGGVGFYRDRLTDQGSGNKKKYQCLSVCLFDGPREKKKEKKERTRNRAPDQGVVFFQREFCSTREKEEEMEEEEEGESLVGARRLGVRSKARYCQPSPWILFSMYLPWHCCLFTVRASLLVGLPVRSTCCTLLAIKRKNIKKLKDIQTDQQTGERLSGQFQRHRRGGEWRTIERHAFIHTKPPLVSVSSS